MSFFEIGIERKVLIEEECRNGLHCIRLLVLVPSCAHCIRRIRAALMSEYLEEVTIGYPHENGSIVELVYQKGKFPEINYLYLAMEARKRLISLGYYVF